VPSRRAQVIVEEGIVDARQVGEPAAKAEQGAAADCSTRRAVAIGDRDLMRDSRFAGDARSIVEKFERAQSKRAASGKAPIEFGSIPARSFRLRLPQPHRSRLIPARANRTTLSRIRTRRILDAINVHGRHNSSNTADFRAANRKSEGLRDRHPCRRLATRQFTANKTK
jgi:hypothetical protein